MFSLRPALERSLVLAAALAATLGAPFTARAQDDPFALPRGATVDTVSRAGTPGLSEIVVDGRRRARMVELEWVGGDKLAIDADQARAAGLPVPDQAAGKVALDSLGLAKWYFDTATQVLTVAMIRHSDGVNLIDLSPRPGNDGDSAALTWARLDYDLTASRTPRQVATGGTLNMAVGRGNLVAGATFIGAVATGSNGHFRRLDTQVQWLMPARSLVATAGDLVTAGSRGQRPLRVGGLQLASDYSLRPDLITTPLPSFTGQVAGPTGVDLLVDGKRTEVGRVEPGEFTVRNVPAAIGRGSVALVVRDALGRESVQTVHFYASPDLLAPGLRQFAANLGFVRRRYGETSNDYGPLVASGFYRRGLSSSLTGEISGETARGTTNVGARADLAIAGFALGSFEARVSRSPGAGQGFLLNGSLESGGKRLSGRVSAVWPSRNYRDAAMALGDPPPQRSLLGQVSFDKGDNRLQLSVGRFERMADPQRGRLSDSGYVANLTARTTISQRFTVNFGGIYRQGNREGRTLAATLGISMRFGANGYSGASATYHDNRPLETSAYFRQPESAAHPLGYALESTRGERDRHMAEMTWRPQQGIFQAQVLRDGGAFSVRGSGRGSLIVAGGGVFARPPSDSSYALVRTGRVGGITVMRENRPAGKTGRNGLLLIDDIPGYVPINYDIDADKLPDDVLTRQTQRRLVIPRRAVGLVEMEVFRHVPQTVRLLDGDGAPLAAGTVLTARPSGAAMIVGFDGEIEVNAVGTDRVLERGGDGQPLCRVTLPARAEATDGDAPPSLACLPVLAAPTTIAQGARGKPRGRTGAASRR